MTQKIKKVLTVRVKGNSDIKNIIKKFQLIKK